MLVDRLHVSVGNTKIGKTANLSLLPVITCPQGVPCARECYARLLLYSPTAEKAWMDNTAFAMNDPVAFITEVYCWLQKNMPKFFRWHVSGDIPGSIYQKGMVDLAVAFPNVRFLVFTKRLEYTWPLQKNLRVIFSAWPEAWMPSVATLKAQGFDGVAYVEGDERAPKDAFVCAGSCERCRACWDREEKALLLHRH